MPAISGSNVGEEAKPARRPVGRVTSVGSNRRMSSHKYKRTSDAEEKQEPRDDVGRVVLIMQSVRKRMCVPTYHVDEN